MDTVLLTTGIALGMEGHDLADLYFRRWPVQENAFKDAVVLGLNEHRGNCGRVVANVAVIWVQIPNCMFTPPSSLRRAVASASG
jgi:hypothetical protein